TRPASAVPITTTSASHSIGRRGSHPAAAGVNRGAAFARGGTRRLWRVIRASGACARGRQVVAWRGAKRPKCLLSLVASIRHENLPTPVAASEPPGNRRHAGARRTEDQQGRRDRRHG